MAIVKRTITGAAGGVMRDILINEEPLIFRKDIYALACVVGGLFYWIGLRLGLHQNAVQIVSALSVVACRIIAVKYHLSLPTLRSYEDMRQDD